MKYIILTLVFFIASSFLFAQDLEKPKKPKKLLKNAEKWENIRMRPTYASRPLGTRLVHLSAFSAS